MREVWMEQENPGSAVTAKTGRDATGGEAHGLGGRKHRSGRIAWYRRWVTACPGGGRGRPRGQGMPSSRIKGSSPFRQLLKTRDTPDEETSDWRAVCGRTARTVRRAGRVTPFPTPIEGQGRGFVLGNAQKLWLHILNPGRDGIVPIWMEFITFEVDGCHLLIGDLDALRIGVGIKFAADGQAGLG